MAEYADPKMPLPPHDLVFNSIGDADLCREGLEAACSVLARTDRPVINHPRAVLKTGRAANAERLRGLPNVVVPRMVTCRGLLLAGPEAAAAVAGDGFSFPFLVRAPGFHTGRYFVRVENLRSLTAAAAEFPGDDVCLIDQLDARDGDGFFRKCRVMIIDRKIYPLHLAISRDWKVHYFRADMAHSAENRAKDEAFLDDMANVIGSRGMAALERINAALDLDYCGIDFAVNADGDILFFEANATMVMVPLSADPKWDYRRPAFDAVFAAVRTMLMGERSATQHGQCKLNRWRSAILPEVAAGSLIFRSTIGLAINSAPSTSEPIIARGAESAVSRGAPIAGDADRIEQHDGGEQTGRETAGGSISSAATWKKVALISMSAGKESAMAGQWAARFAATMPSTITSALTT